RWGPGVRGPGWCTGGGVEKTIKECCTGGGRGRRARSRPLREAPPAQRGPATAEVSTCTPATTQRPPRPCSRPRPSLRGNEPDREGDGSPLGRVAKCGKHRKKNSKPPRRPAPAGVLGETPAALYQRGCGTTCDPPPAPFPDARLWPSPLRAPRSTQGVGL